MIRQVRLFTGDDGQSHVEETVVNSDAASPWNDATRIRFEETAAGSSLEWHVAPQRQYVLTLTGTLEFTTRDGATFVLSPGDVLLAEDTAGGGHRWQLIDDQPWRRAYVTLPPPSPRGGAESAPE